ncbi:ClpXP protease specificity-enhancing factor [Photobacterium angustum]|uniref:Stringent starvation protein B n=2 Tax=Photobacterium angustum TaxID=661 RepID=A0A2S7W0Q8_PHOAN|nr:ClpXP protease specificity-enhancing factor [Photobacterium angustum]KJF81169.1 Clp protease ClpP [Photobacterium damselae subsp. damselae]KJG16698.1 Clp protease ClpP [Photobacterium angustum]KJG22968.1 Clp protease ClpP [Photobacterium angustum]KJG29586.1 Clp protease ClpP [Photobacterium angustum]KJG29936.1 Clp protease ClpP [Photobacterium angustum]
MDMEKMTPRRPYLLRAFYDWLVDNDLTPHLVVDATLPGVQVPMEFVSDGQIILNVAPRAVGNLELGNEAVSFNARFSGRPHSVIVPMYAVLAVYARENGAGTMFEPEPSYESDMPVFDDVDDIEDMIDEASEPSSPFAVVSETETAGDEPDDEPPRPRGRPSLRVVK